ncbi:hypothetical protein [Solibacillus sp. FSL H8-0538]|uniref:hypothetical protein n=1 Tax=Solibacillus sp. FSL H8-0538 TaxID=2921400 RepID=UPI0030F83084
MRKVTTIVAAFVIVLLVGYFSIRLYTDMKLNGVKEKVIENNPGISKVENINSKNHWGEWFSEYILVVEMNGLKYRIWTSDEGEITDKEAL